MSSAFFSSLKNLIIKKLLFLLMLLLSQTATATFIDINTLYFSDQFTTATATKTARTQYDIGFGFDVSKSRQLILALDTGSTSFTDVNAAATITTLSITDLGIKLIYFWDKGKVFSTAVSYNLISTAKYNDGSSAVELRGSSTKADLGYHIWFGDSFALGLKFFYYAATYKESIASSTITNVAYNRVLIYPSLSLAYYY